jgi:hypothetical protein
MHIRRILSLVVVALLIVAGVWYVVMVVPRNAPWEESGTVVVVTRAIPEPARNASAVLGFGLADVRLAEGDGAVRLALTTRRILLDVQDTRPYELLRTNVHTGSYTGIGFSMKSPELRNDWQEDSPPEHIALGAEEIFLDTPFTVEADTITVIILGFESLQAIRPRDDAVVYLPVIHTEVRTGAVVEPGEGTSVTVREGSIVHNVIFGMDWDGVMRKNFRTRAVASVEGEPTPVVTQEVPEVVDMAPEETASTSVSTSTATSLDMEVLMGE